MRTVPDDRLPIIDGDIARLRLTMGQIAIIDADDAHLVANHCWHDMWNPKMGTHYAARNGRTSHDVGTSVILLHRVLAGAGAGQFVDHANRNTLDNRRSNLRIATRTDNQRNRGLAVDNTSGYLGVHYRMRGHRKPWTAHIGIEGRSKHIGYYATALEAALARDQFIRENCPSEFWTFNVPLLPGERGITQPEGATA